ncbi:Streptomycin biosynthesis operon possible regulatory protein, putative OS=Acaryochloris marina (strain MBIC 11017) GN=AM1_F0130 PE=4 SV=1 [Gemmataceae bacterium]|nr:Streptomycin biosynthesis operon possible regulatory protein, putative OS=Acaryochloris marina (strain MBIC 11017) GN=AM1_F0130 PE=4 SV=1 [Gemmataceae bacterium]VTT98902.1 Streptomycin biosynthesis operon possible regulatory protein, putative OS=Acaryochloris marina (strain MBIC 11017) GN=AM1_F0130 PE=4 SV=1 [Gemmataceae bacterium]
MADPLRAAVRRAITGGRWHSPDDVLAVVAADVPDALALRTFARLQRARGRDPGDDAGRLAIGRARVAREQLQRLVHEGRAEAVGDGADRRYRLTQGLPEMSDRPKPRRVWLPIERIVRDPLLQLRRLPGGATTDPKVVEAYREVIDDPDEDGLPPVDVVSDADDPTVADATNWLTDGFQRLAAHEAAGKASVECVVYKGTHRDALLRALGANKRQSLLARTDADRRHSVETLLSAPDLMKRVRAAAKEDGVSGTTRALAQACGVSKGLVAKVLKEKGLVVTRKGDVVPALKEPAAPPPPAEPVSPARASEPEEPEPEPTAAGPAYTVTPARPRSEAELLADVIAAIRDRVERYAESVEGRWLLGAAGPMGLPLVRDDSSKLLAISAAISSAAPGYQTAKDRKEVQHAAESAARFKEQALPRGAAECEWLRDLWVKLTDRSARRGA